MVFRSALLCLLLAVLPACTSGSTSEAIEFVHTFDGATETSVWTATGESIDNGFLCPAATGFLKGFEDEDGNTRTFEELAALNEGSDPFVSVSVESMVCDDDSGNFTLRFINQIDPSAAERLVSTTWTIAGGAEYEATDGSGNGAPPQSTGTTAVWTASGTLTTG